jgi:hypothetical protein
VKGPDRAEVWRLLGAPAEQIGSVNDPRTLREGGFDWNEKWVHRNREGRVERVVLWNRYDLLGVFRVDESGALHPEALPEA